MSPTSRSPNFSIIARIALGTAAGMAVGIGWTILTGLEKKELSAAVGFILAMTWTGIVVGGVTKYPELVGLATGTLTASVLAVIIGPMDGWLAIWLMVFGGSGLLCGPVVGGWFRLLKFVFLRGQHSAENGVSQEVANETDSRSPGE